MVFTNTSISWEPKVTPQSLHREAVEELKKAIKQHQQAALLLEAGDARQAVTHGNIADNHTAHALLIGARALEVLP